MSIKQGKIYYPSSFQSHFSLKDFVTLVMKDIMNNILRNGLIDPQSMVFVLSVKFNRLLNHIFSFKKHTFFIR